MEKLGPIFLPSVLFFYAKQQFSISLRCLIFLNWPSWITTKEIKYFLTKSVALHSKSSRASDLESCFLLAGWTDLLPGNWWGKVELKNGNRKFLSWASKWGSCVHENGRFIIFIKEGSVILVIMHLLRLGWIGFVWWGNTYQFALKYTSVSFAQLYLLMEQLLIKLRLFQNGSGVELG